MTRAKTETNTMISTLLDWRSSTSRWGGLDGLLTPLTTGVLMRVLGSNLVSETQCMENGAPTESLTV